MAVIFGAPDDRRNSHSGPAARVRYLLEVPPDVTTGCVVVVVGATVVEVVVGGIVGGVVVTGAASAGAVAGEGDPVEPGAEGAGVDVVVVVGTVVGTAGEAGAFELAEEPGCSLATVTPMNAVAPLATTMAPRVSRLTRAWARARAAGEYRRRSRLVPDGDRAGPFALRSRWFGWPIGSGECTQPT